MVWNVYREDFNHRAIVKYNIFDHSGLAQDVNKLLKEDISKDEFAEQLKRSLMYWFLGKTEYEVVVSSWIPHIDEKELNRLNVEYEEHYKKWNNYPIRMSVNLNVGEKIDIYEQIKINWDVFVNYLWQQKKKRGTVCAN